MIQGFLGHLATLHGGTPAVLSQATLAVMFAVLGIVVMGIGFGRLAKTIEGLRQHRWALTVAVVLTLGAVSLVMLPSAFLYYIDPGVQFFSALSLTTVVHAALGAIALSTALIYVFGDLPVQVKQWMRITAILWVASLSLGVLMFLQMLGLV